MDRYAVRSQKGIAISNIALGDGAGAAAFLPKPFEDQKLLDAVYSALKSLHNDKAD